MSWRIPVEGRKRNWLKGLAKDRGGDGKITAGVRTDVFVKAFLDLGITSTGIKTEQILPKASINFMMLTNKGKKINLPLNPTQLLKTSELLQPPYSRMLSTSKSWLRSQVSQWSNLHTLIRSGPASKISQGQLGILSLSRVTHKF